MQRDFKLRKQAILAGLALLFCADAALAVYSWQMAAAPSTPQQVLLQQTRQLELLKADIKRAREIREKIPAIQKGFDKFEGGFPPVTTGYSVVSAELGAIASEAGVKLDDVRFHQKDIPTRNLSEVEIEATVNGDYARVVHFINGLQRSNNVYDIESLALDSEAQSQGPTSALKVNLHMKTYFRAAG